MDLKNLIISMNKVVIYHFHISWSNDHMVSTFQTEIIEIANIVVICKQTNKTKNLWFCVPNLKIFNHLGTKLEYILSLKLSIS